MKRSIAAVCMLAALAPSCSRAPVKAVAVTVSGYEFGFRAPQKIKGGLVDLTFQNTGGIAHQAQLMRLDASMSATTAVQALRANRQGGFPEGIHAAGGTEEVAAGRSATFSLNLSGGHYVLLCFVGGSNPHWARGMAKPLDVSPGRSGALPAATGSLVAREYAYDVDGLKAGTQVLSVRNDGPGQPHVFEFLEYPAGVSVSDVEGYVDAYRRRKDLKSARSPKGVGGFGAIEPKGRATFTATLRKGRTYLLLCFLTDRGSSQTHWFRGMFRVFTVS